MLRQHRFYKSVWYWSEEDNKLSIGGAIDKEKPKIGAPISSTKLLDKLHQNPAAFYFTDSIDQNQQMIFRQRYQKGIKPHIPNVVTMQDIKDVVLFLANGYIPSSFIDLFCSIEIDLLIRSVILYIQLFLKVWEDLEYRSHTYKNQRLKHPISIERETRCKNNLSKLRSRIGQEYALIISGEGNYKIYHHMNNTLNRSYTNQDITLYDYLSKFITKTVWIALNRTNYKEIETEIYRLFNFKDVHREKTHMKCNTKSEHESEGHVLHGDKIQYLSKWHRQSPVISDIFRNKEIPDILLENGSSDVQLEKTTLKGLEAALNLPEELLARLGITVGILGQPRDSFEPLLTVRQRQKSIEDEEMEKMIAACAEEEKPKIKMYEYLDELEVMIDLTNFESTEDEKTNISIFDEIILYEKSHIEDSIRSYKLWKQRKDSSFYIV